MKDEEEFLVWRIIIWGGEFFSENMKDEEEFLVWRIVWDGEFFQKIAKMKKNFWFGELLFKMMNFFLENMKDEKEFWKIIWNGEFFLENMKDEKEFLVWRIII